MYLRVTSSTKYSSCLLLRGNIWQGASVALLLNTIILPTNEKLTTAMMQKISLKRARTSYAQRTMATLLPSLSSDEEDNNISTKKNKNKNKNSRMEVESDDDDSDVDEDLNDDFEFGGIMGEDGGLPSGLVMKGPSAGWSYQKALDNLESSQSEIAAANPRMDIASIIEAKRKSLKKHGKNEERNQVTEEEEDDEDADEDQNEQSEAKSSEEESSSDDADAKEEDDASSESEDDSSDESGDDDEDDVVDDAGRDDMEDDVLKTRMGDETKKQNVSASKKNKETSDNDEVEDAEQSDDSDSDEEEEEDKEEAEKAAKFFDSQATQDTDEIEMFSQLTLSRPLLRGIASMGFIKPTPIQASVIPVALAGRDICASAVTGSGKTAAFLLPIMERLLHRPAGRIKAIILTPTRELAAQCLGMLSTLTQFTKIQSTLIVGGAKNSKAQIAELRARPQIVVATPGRLLDHIMNSQGVDIDDVEFLVLDEADRLLDLGFHEEVTEIIQACPTERQTLLFSATLNTKVDDLIKLSLKRPVRMRISDQEKSSNDLEVAPRLEQEFVRVRSGNEGINREGMLLALLTRVYQEHVIVFFDTKALAHRMMIVCGLCGIKCAELHGNLTQTQRLEALEKFRKGEVDVLLATDLAARGLDINHVRAVVNFEMPSQVSTYIHRIGRTARAGRGGKSCTMIGEGRRHLMKDIMKDAAQKAKGADSKKSKKPDSAKKSHPTAGIIRSRAIPPGVISHFVAKIFSLDRSVREVLQAEAVAKMDRLAEMEAAKAQNILEHEDEINARPKREWFASEREKQQTKEAAAEKAQMIAEKAGTGLHRMTRKKRRAREAREMLEESLAEEAQDGGGGDGDEQVSRIPSIKSTARAHKKKEQEREQAKYEESLHDADLQRELKKKRQKSTHAAGDSSLFAEENVTFAKKKKTADAPAASNYDFRGHDPALEGRKRTKKKSVNKFKSKSKYKRN